MIICPLSSDECSKHIIPAPKTAFLMTPSAAHMPAELMPVVDSVTKILGEKALAFIKGASLVDIGDYLCTIFRNLQGCPLGIAISSSGVPRTTISNMYWEMGLMQGFGRPVILLTDKKSTLPSDLVRTYAIFFKQHGYLDRLRELLQVLMDREGYYSDTLAETALEAGDYEKAGLYYQAAYLIGEDAENLYRMQSLADTLRRKRGIPAGYKKRLIESLTTFVSETSRTAGAPNQTALRRGSKCRR
jgi:hypothetical protein